MPEKYTLLAGSQIKIKKLDRLSDFLRKVEDKSSPARRTFKKFFDKKVRNPKRVEPVEWFYIVKHTVVVRRQEEKASTDDPSVNLSPEREDHRK